MNHENYEEKLTGSLHYKGIEGDIKIKFSDDTDCSNLMDIVRRLIIAIGFHPLSVAEAMEDCGNEWSALLNLKNEKGDE